jgi:hypothetical protein
MNDQQPKIVVGKSDLMQRHVLGDGIIFAITGKIRTPVAANT